MEIKQKGEERIHFDRPEKITIGIVQALWNDSITGQMAQECIDALIHHGIQKDKIIHKTVPGSFELPLGAQMMENTHHPDAIICLGCVIKGETDHDVYINQSVSQTLMNLNVRDGKPFVFGVLTVNTEKQAVQRSNGEKGNKGKESAEVALHMLTLRNTLKSETSQNIGFRSAKKQ